MICRRCHKVVSNGVMPADDLAEVRTRAVLYVGEEDVRYESYVVPPRLICMSCAANAQKAKAQVERGR